MTPEKYKKYIDTCKTREEMLVLIENTKNNNRIDLVEIAQAILDEKFPLQGKWRPATGRAEIKFSPEQSKEIYKGHPTLNPDEIEFLTRHSIPPSSLFNATGKTKPIYQAQMRIEECDIAYGAAPCLKSGHRLRTRAGHCIQCNPANLSYQLRHNRSGEVYVAESIDGGRIVKVGSSESSATRISGLISERYAGRSDWTRTYYFGVNNMGLVELQVHAALLEYAIIDKYYLKDEQKTLCREIFSCSTEMAIEELKKIISKHSK